MKLHTTTAAGLNTITAYGEGYVSVNGQRLTHSFLLTPNELHENWAVSAVSDLSTDAIGKFFDMNCDILVLGTGSAQIFPPRDVLRALQERRIGVEIMDSFAACRTYNILVLEGRAVALALIMETRA